MPLNKEALIRYRVINRCLVESRYVSKARLIRACEEALDIAPIGERTIDQDIHDMREDTRLGFHAPIRHSREKNGYYYEDPDYSIDKIPLNEEELEALSFASTMLEQYKHIDLFTTFTGAVQKIVDAVNIHRMLKTEPSSPFIQFESVPEMKGSEYLMEIIEAIRDKKVLDIKHKRFDSEKAYLHIVHPYLLKEYRNRWYLIGLNDDIEQIRTYGLDRIQEISVNREIEFFDAGFDPAEYFKSAIGIIAPETKPQVVILKFAKDQGQYVITQPIHESQEIVEETDTHVIISLHIIPTFELVSLILGWGAAVEVMEPASLKQRIKKIIDQMQKLY